MGRYTITDQRGQKQEEVFSLSNENLNEEEFELSEEADDIYIIEEWHIIKVTFCIPLAACLT